MADEFAKGLTIGIAGGLGWMTLAGWYTTTSFGSGQLVGSPPDNPDVYGEIALIFKDAFFWFAILGMLTFWVLIPAFNRLQERTAEDTG
jgi:Zn-dependent protease with chaperone function